MSDFLSEIKKVDEEARKVAPSRHSRKEKLDELTVSCEPFIQECMDRVKQNLLHKAKKQERSYNISEMIVKRIKSHPIYETHLEIYYEFDMYKADFQKKQVSRYGEFLTDVYTTHSPDLLFYFISELCNKLEEDGIIPFIWKHSGGEAQKAIPVSYPTSTQKKKILESYKLYTEREVNALDILRKLDLYFKVDAK